MSADSDVIRGTILRAVHGGYGLLKEGGRTVFVRGALPGEAVVARLRSHRKGVHFAEVAEVIQPAEGRREGPCPVAARCGGCHFQHAAPEAQRAAKEAGLRELLDRARIELPIARWHSGPESGWRCRIELHGEAGEGGFRLGFFEERSHRPVPADACLQISEALRRLVGDLGTRLGPIVQGPASVEVAESFDGAQRVLVTDDQAAAISLAKDRESLGLAGVAWRHDRFEARTLAGEGWIEDRLGGVSLRHHALSFFQANRHLTDTLLDRVLASVREAGDGPVVDLFSGVGLFSLPLAREGREVVSVEWGPSAFRDLLSNAERAGVSIDAQNLGVGNALAEGLSVEDRIVIVDPPRRGLDPMELEALAEGSPRRIVYVSCDPATLARDIGRFGRAGYAPIALEAFDLFPTTFHLETLTVLVPR